jgi:hypothetical protein
MSDEDLGLDRLGTCPRAELIELWEAAYRRPPPKGISRRLLEYAAAYHIQAQRYGGLKPSTRRKLLQIAQQHRASKESGQPVPKKRARLAPGTRLIRDWHGRTHTVDVLDGGFRYDDRTYKSLSEIARLITGAHWSGPRFFGLE